jgi:hypothetical protein
MMCVQSNGFQFNVAGGFVDTILNNRATSISASYLHLSTIHILTWYDLPYTDRRSRTRYPSAGHYRGNKYDVALWNRSIGHSTTMINAL